MAKRRRTVRRAVAGAAAALLVLTSLQALTMTSASAVGGAAGGDLDPTFGTGGVTTQFPPGPPFNYEVSGFSGGAVATDATGRFVMAGSSLSNRTPADRDSVLTRFTAAGQPDTTFNGAATGIESDQSGTGINDAYVGVGVAADKSIYTAAAYGDINADAARVRVEKRNDLGAGPAAFFVLGGGGAGLTSVSGSGLVVQPDGKVLVSGSENVDGDAAGLDFDRMWVVRLNADLTLDATFGTDGTAYVSFGTSRAVNQSLALQPDGKILLGGHIRVPVDDSGVARLMPNGVLDTSFGSDGTGIAVWDASGLRDESSLGAEDHAAAIAVAPDGRIAVGGGIFQGENSYHVSLLSSAGSLVAGFANSGVHRDSGFALWPGSLAWDSAGRILVGAAGGAGFNALRLDGTTGTLDTAFGASGLATAPCASGGGVSGTVPVAGGDRIVVLGACEGKMMLAGFVGVPPALGSVSLSISEVTTTPPGASDIAVSDIPASAVPLDALSDVAGIPLRSVDLAASPLRSVPLRSVPLRSVPLRSVPLRSVLLSDIPLRSVGAWDAVLATLNPNPFVGVPLQSITLDQVLEAFDAQPNATGLSTVTLSDVDLGSTPLRSVTMASIALGSTPLRSVPIEDANGVVPSGDAVFAGWCSMLRSLGYSCEALGLTAESPILALDLASVPLRSVPLRSVPLRSVDLTAAPLRSVPLRSVNLAGIPLGDLPLSTIDPQSSIVDCSKVDCATRSLADAAAAQALVSTATLGTLFDVVPQDKLPGSLLELLQGLINVRDYPWEKLPLDAVGIADFQQDGPTLRYRLDVAMTGAGLAPSTAVVTLPAGFRYVRGSSTMNGVPLGDPTVSASGLTWQLGLPGGSTSSVLFGVRPGLDLGTYTSSATVTAGGTSASAAGTAPVQVVENGEIEIVGECRPIGDPPTCTPSGGTPSNNTAPGLPVEGNTLYISHIGGPGDVDYYSLPVPPKGTRIQVQLGVPEGADYDVAMFNGAQATPLRSVPLRSVPLRSVPLPDQGLSTDTSTLSPETLQDIPTLEGIPLRSVSENRSDSEELIDTTSDAVPTSGQGYTLQVSGFNGSSSTKPYVLYIKQYAPPTPPTCPARTFAFPGEGVAGTAPTDLGNDRETLFLVSPERLGDTYGQARVQAVMDRLGLLAARADVKGLVYPVEGKPAAAAALGVWDADPCKPDLANAAFRAVATIVDDVRAANSGLKNVVVVGGDDLIPMARVADYTQLSNESDYASSLLKADGSTGTPIAAALASENILTDDPLGVSAPIAWLDHQLYVPDVAVGRLVESPEAIVGQIEQYIAANGLLDPKTSLTTGYDFLSDGAGAVDSALSRIPVADRKTLINETWSRTDLNAQLFPTGGATPDIATVNAHYDHNRSLPAQGNSTHDESDLFTVADVDAHPQAMISRILFTMGCHAGLNVPDAYLDPADANGRDWAQTYLDTGQKAAVYLANTGYGYGDTATIALSEQLMQLFAERLDGSMTVGQAAAYAKQAYFGQLGAYGPYDEKAMQEATFYGLPMYRIGAAGVTPPATATVTPSAAGNGVSSLPVSVEPTFTANTSPGGGTFYTVGNEAPQVTQYRPIVPRTSRPVTPSDPAVGVAHGFLTTSLVSRDVATVPAVARPVVDQGANEPPPASGEVAFPTSFSNLTTFSTPNGPEQRLVVLPGQVFRDASWQGAGAVARLFDKIGGEVKYSTSDDFTAPFLTNVSATLSGSTLSLSLDATDASGIATVLVLVKDESGIWRSVALTQNSGVGPYIGSLTVQGSLIEYFAQAQDTAGNVGISTNKGRYYSALLPPVGGEQPAPPVLSTTPVQPTGSGGWYRSDTAVTLTQPAGSTATYAVAVDTGPAQQYQGPVTVSRDGLHTVRAKGSDGTSALLIVPIDSTNPTVTVGGVVGGGVYPTAPRPTCEGVDATSGIATCTVTVTGGAGQDGVGTLTATATAYDRAGHSATTSVTYTAGFGGFLQPINHTGHTVTSTTSVFKVGSTIPVKFQILDPSGQPIELATAPVWLDPQKSGALDGTAPNETSVTATASTGSTFTYDPVSKTYSYNWRTKKEQGGFYWKIAARLSDGTVYWTYIGLR